jgi:hypothetical protein
MLNIGEERADELINLTKRYIEKTPDAGSALKMLNDDDTVSLNRLELSMIASSIGYIYGTWNGDRSKE